MVAAGLARQCEVQVAYAIGVPDPVSVMVETFATGQRPDAEIAAAIGRVFDLKPRAIIEALGLRNPIYRKTASYGHFGREPEDGFFTWERTDRVEELRGALS